jgi:uncharacterized protein involved in outer membrane biogenesis
MQETPSKQSSRIHLFPSRVSSILKYSIITIVSLIIVLALGIIILVNFVNPNRYKPIIINAVHENTGRKLTLDGDINWKIWPKLGLNIKQASLSNPSEFDENTKFATIKDVNISVELIPLFHGTAIVNTIDLDGLNLNLMVANDKNNWTFTAAKTESTTQVDEKKKEKPTQLELYNFSLSNSNINYTDLNAKTSRKFNNLNLSLSTNKNGGIYFDPEKQSLKLDDVTLKFNNLIAGNINFNMDNNSEFTGIVDFNTFSLNGLFSFFGSKPPLNSKSLNNIPFKATITGNKNDITLKNLTFNTPGLIAGSAHLNVKNIQTNLAYTGTVNLTALSINALSSAIGFKLPLNSKALDNVPLKVNIAGDKNSANLQNLTFRASGLIAGVANLHLTNISTNLTYNGTLNLSTLAVNNLFLAIGSKPPINSALLNDVPLKVNIVGDKNNLNLNNLLFRVGEAQVSGLININHANTLQIANNLAVSMIEVSNHTDLNGYKVAVSNIKVKGNLSKGANANAIAGTQHITAGNITISGFDLKNFADDVNQVAAASLVKIIGETTRAISSGNIEHIIELPNVVAIINKLRDSARKASAPGPKNLNQKTNLGQLDTTMVLNNNLISTPSFNLSGPNLKLTATGQTNLNNNTLGYNGLAKIQGVPAKSFLANITFPYKVEGNLDHPKASLGWGSITTQIGKYYLKQATDLPNIAKSIVHEVTRGAGDIVKGVQNGSGDIGKDLQKGVEGVVNGLFK